MILLHKLVHILKGSYYVSVVIMTRPNPAFENVASLNFLLEQINGYWPDPFYPTHIYMNWEM